MIARRVLLTVGLAAALGCGSDKAPKGEGGSDRPAASAEGSAAPPQASAAAPGGVEQVTLAKQIVTWLDEGQHAKVRALFDEAMEKALPNDQALSQSWAGVETQFGQLKQQLGATVQAHPPYTIVLVTCVFQVSPMDVRIVFDKEGLLAGFQVVATQNPEAFGERPQTPKPPFPYTSREVEYDNAAGKIRIGGTLTLPPGSGPHPVVLLITGSGPQDRDETLFGHKPFLVIADHLTRRGIAVLRVDDRGVGKTGGDPATATVEDHVTDVEAGVAFLKAQKEIDARRIGLIGHSEGGLIAPIVAAKSSDVAFIVSLAGPAVSGAELNPLQVGALLAAQGVPAAVIAEIVAGQKKLMELLVRDAPEAELRAALKELAKVAVKAAPGADPDDVEAQKATGVELSRLLSPWFRSWAKLDPAPHLGKVRVPLLLLIGEKDLQVPADVNIAKAKAAAAGNATFRAEKLAGLNHLFQSAKTGAVEEYVALPETFNLGALTLMTDWLLDVAKTEIARISSPRMDRRDQFPAGVRSHR
jgi:hypothetical protein